MPVFELEKYPQSVIQEYKALNIVSPFTNDAQISRDGLLIQLIRNQNVTKKQHLRTAEELLPYLKEYPDYLEHPTIKKVNTILSNIKSDEQMAHILKSIAEEIEIETAKDEPDSYLVNRLSQLYIKHSKASK